MEIPPCVLQDIGPLGPLPKKEEEREGERKREKDGEKEGGKEKGRGGRREGGKARGRKGGME